MSTELIINASLPETRIALMENSEIQDLLIERATGKGIVGNIYKGRVTRVLPGMQAAFVDIGLEKAAFLYVDDVFVHSNKFQEDEEEEEKHQPRGRRIEPAPETDGDVGQIKSAVAAGALGAPGPQVTDEETREWADEAERDSDEAPEPGHHDEGRGSVSSHEDPSEEDDEDEGEDEEDDADLELEDEDDDDGDDHGPVGMGPDSGDGGDEDRPPGTVTPPPVSASGEGSSGEGGGGSDAGPPGETAAERKHRRGRRGGRNRRGGRDRDGEPRAATGGEGRGPRLPGVLPVGAEGGADLAPGDVHSSFSAQIVDELGEYQSDRAAISNADKDSAGVAGEGRPDIIAQAGTAGQPAVKGREKAEFKEPRDRNRKIKGRGSMRPPKPQVSIQDLLKEGQEVLVQVAKDPIATKGARLTCHISLPGRHLVCMPTIDHVGVSRRIERDEERRRLRDTVEKNRPKGLGFIVRTASGKQSSAEKRIIQDIEYLSRLWTEIREKASQVSAPAMVYEDLNSVLRAIRDWVTEDIDKIVVDSRYHYNDIQRFAAHFMPSLKQKIELYHGDTPIFDAYGISTELSRALERKVWLKSGGYLVVDQAEALVAIDVNTGRYVGKKSLEDTILKTNLEAVQEIAYQLRLRNCGGIIILDLIDMEKEENKQRVYKALEEALKKDRARPSILKISELGLVEMTRKRTRDTMVRALCDSCTHCEGKGFVKSKVTVGYEILRELEREGIDREATKILIQAHPEVIDVLAIDERETMDQLERRYRKQIYLQAVGDFHMEQFDLSADKKSAVKAGIETREDRNRARRERSGGGGSGGGNRDQGRGERGGRDRGGRDRDRGGRDRDQERGAKGGRSGGLPQARNLEGGAPSAGPAGGAGGEHHGANGMSGEHAPAGPPVDTSTMSEDDRLAYVRAQAAQDAAIARTGAPDGAPGPRGPGGAGGPAGGKRDDRGGEGGARRRRGRRGGRFRNRDRAAGGPGGEGGGGSSEGGGSGGGDGGGGGSSGSGAGPSGGSGGGDAPGPSQD